MAGSRTAAIQPLGAVLDFRPPADTTPIRSGAALRDQALDPRAGVLLKPSPGLLHVVGDRGRCIGGDQVANDSNSARRSSK